MFINRLKDHYPHAIESEGNKIPIDSKLTIISESGESLVIDKRVLSKEEVTLLETLFSTKTETTYIPKTKLEELLYSLLIQRETISLTEIEKHLTFPSRIIHFYIKGTLGNQEELEEALNNLFPSTLQLLWKDSQEGFLIQTIDTYFEEDVSIESIADTIASDFFVQIFFYVGSPITDVNKLANQYRWEKNAFQLVKGINPTKNVFIEQEVIPYMMMKDLQDETKKSITDMLQPVIKDTDLMESVKIYLECNMNASLAAKKMYMHRNTIQYRVDKFIEKTSIDIKQFPNAVAVYFMFIVIQNNRTEH